jgi:predicted patatin/cPLA2 family phospholipase
MSSLAMLIYIISIVSFTKMSSLTATLRRRAILRCRANVRYRANVVTAATQKYNDAWDAFDKINAKGERENQPTDKMLVQLESNIEKWSKDWSKRNKQAMKDLTLVRSFLNLACNEYEKATNDLENAYRLT